MRVDVYDKLWSKRRSKHIGNYGKEYNDALDRFFADVKNYLKGA